MKFDYIFLTNKNQFYYNRLVFLVMKPDKNS